MNGLLLTLDIAVVVVAVDVVVVVVAEVSLAVVVFVSMTCFDFFFFFSFAFSFFSFTPAIFSTKGSSTVVATGSTSVFFDAFSTASLDTSGFAGVATNSTLSRLGGRPRFRSGVDGLFCFFLLVVVVVGETSKLSSTSSTFRGLSLFLFCGVLTDSSDDVSVLFFFVFEGVLVCVCDIV